METSETLPANARPVVHVHGSDSLAERVAKCGWDVVRVDGTGAASALAKGLAVIGQEGAEWSDDRLAAAVCAAVATHSITHLNTLRAEARKATHDARNSVGLLWLHLAALERATAGALNGAAPEAKEVIDQIKDETRAIVALLDQLSAAARR